MPNNVKAHLVVVSILTALQWVMFSANGLIGLFGLPILVIWGLLGDTRNAPDLVWLHRVFTWVIAAGISYLPMAATLLGIKLWPG